MKVVSLGTKKKLSWLSWLLIIYNPNTWCRSALEGHSKNHTKITPIIRSFPWIPPTCAGWRHGRGPTQEFPEQFLNFAILEVRMKFHEISLGGFMVSPSKPQGPQTKQKNTSRILEVKYLGNLTLPSFTLRYINSSFFCRPLAANAPKLLLQRGRAERVDGTLLLPRWPGTSTQDTKLSSKSGTLEPNTIRLSKRARRLWNETMPFKMLFLIMIYIYIYPMNWNDIQFKHSGFSHQHVNKLAATNHPRYPTSSEKASTINGYIHLQKGKADP